jgi:hypothetical protein
MVGRAVLDLACGAICQLSLCAGCLSALHCVVQKQNRSLASLTLARRSTEHYHTLARTVPPREFNRRNPHATVWPRVQM